MIVRFVMRLHISRDLLERLSQIVGIGDQKSARVLGQCAQTRLCIGSTHGILLVVALPGKLHLVPGAAGRGAHVRSGAVNSRYNLSLLLAQGSDVLHRHGGGLRRGRLVQTVGVEGVNADIRRDGLIHHRLELVGVAGSGQSRAE